MGKTTKAGDAAPLIERARALLRRWRGFDTSEGRQLVALVAGVSPGLLRDDHSPEAERAVMLELAATFEEVAGVAQARGLDPTRADDFARHLRGIVGRIADPRASLVARHARGGRPTTLERQALRRRAWDAENLLPGLDRVGIPRPQERAPRGARRSEAYQQAEKAMREAGQNGLARPTQETLRKQLGVSERSLRNWGWKALCAHYDYGVSERERKEDLRHKRRRERTGRR